MNTSSRSFMRKSKNVLEDFLRIPRRPGLAAPCRFLDASEEGSREASGITTLPETGREVDKAHDGRQCSRRWRRK